MLIDMGKYRSSDPGRGDLSIGRLHRNDLMAGRFYGSRFVNIDMTCFSADHSLIGFQQTDGQNFALRSARNIMNIYILKMQLGLDRLCRLSAINIQTVTFGLRIVGLNQSIQNLWTCSFGIVICERIHLCYLFIIIYYNNLTVLS